MVRTASIEELRVLIGVASRKASVMDRLVRVRTDDGLASNLLHLALKVDDSSHIVSELLHMLPLSVTVDMMCETNNDGLTPLHAVVDECTREGPLITLSMFLMRLTKSGMMNALRALSVVDTDKKTPSMRVRRLEVGEKRMHAERLFALAEKNVFT